MSLFTHEQLAAWRRLGVRDDDITPEQLRRIQEEYRHLGPRIVALWDSVRARGDTEAHLSINGLYERDCPVCKNVTRITPAETPLADTSHMGGAVSPQLEKANMFKIEKTNYIVTAVLFFALVAAVIG